LQHKLRNVFPVLIEGQHPMSRFFLCSLCVLFLIIGTYLCLPTFFQSDARPVEKVQGKYNANDIHRIPPEDIAKDFLQVAFNRDDWSVNFPPIVKGASEDRFLNRKNIPERVRDIITRPEGVPHTDGVLKFNPDQKILVNIWAQTGVSETWFGEDDGAILKKYTERITAETLPQLAAATALNIALSSSPRETWKKDGTINIELSRFSNRNFFKLEKGLEDYPLKGMSVDTNWRREEYRFYKGVVEFTPDMRSQVDGFIVLNLDGSIRYAKCRIWSQHEQDMLAALLQECLIRSLGLINNSAVTYNALLTNWNSGHDPYSALYRYDRENYRAHHGGLIGGDAPPKEATYGTPESTMGWAMEGYTPYWRKEVKKRTNKTETVSTGITKYDLLLLSILYNPQVTAGMKLFDINNILYTVVKETLKK